MNLCGFIADPGLRHRLTSLAQRASWGCWLTDSVEALATLVHAISPPPDLILSDQASAFANLQIHCPGVYFGSLANAPDSREWLFYLTEPTRARQTWLQRLHAWPGGGPERPPPRQAWPGRESRQRHSSTVPAHFGGVGCQQKRVRLTPSVARRTVYDPTASVDSTGVSEFIRNQRHHPSCRS